MTLDQLAICGEMARILADGIPAEHHPMTAVFPCDGVLGIVVQLPTTHRRIQWDVDHDYNLEECRQWGVNEITRADFVTEEGPARAREAVAWLTGEVTQ